MINKFQQGGSTQQGSVLQQIQQLPEEQQKQIMQAFAKWAQQKGVDLKQIQNNPQALEAALGQFIQELQQASQGQQTVAARHGAKLNYVKALKNQCPDGYELFYYKKGGMLKCGCAGKKFEDGGRTEKENSVTKFKNKIRKNQIGGYVDYPANNALSNAGEGLADYARDIASYVTPLPAARRLFNRINNQNINRIESFTGMPHIGGIAPAATRIYKKFISSPVIKGNPLRTKRHITDIEKSSGDAAEKIYNTEEY